MSLANLLKELSERREARTRCERHGASELTVVDGVPMRATGCRLPDGSLTDAECLLPHIEVADERARVWARRLPGTPLSRRGRLRLEPGTALLFVDEPDADLATVPDRREPPPDLRLDLGRSARVRELVRSELIATLLYDALCNTLWRHGATGTPWRCSWRAAGGIVADLRGEGDYLDWYCSMGEGVVDERVLAEIEALGWALVEAEPPDY